MAEQSDSEERAREILDHARSQRRGSSRTTWLLALSIGSACLVGFVIVAFAVLASESTASNVPHSQSSSHGFGFAIGLTAGLVIGIAIGFAIARHRERERQVSRESSASHSDRSNP